MHDTLVERLARFAPWWVLIHVACWPWSGLAEVFLSLGALLGFGLMWAVRFRGALRVLSHEAWALTSILFLGYWLPQVLSVPLALDPGRTAIEAAKDLRYLPFLWLVAMAVSTPRGARIVGIGLAAVVGFWTVDGLVQAGTGASLGGPALADRLTGIFGADNPKLGLVLATLSPFALLPAARRGLLPGGLVALALGVVILLAGTRAAWISFGLALLLVGLRHWGGVRTMLGLGLAAALALAVAVTSDRLAPRIERSVAAFQMDPDGLDFALSGRIELWRTTLRIIAAHPLTGVGTDNFQRAYADAAAPADPFLASGGQGAFHAHHVVLEVLSETGALGLLLWFAAVAIALRAWRFAAAEARERAAAPGFALLVTLFPLNTHLAFYSTFWGGMTLLLAALYAGALLRRDLPAQGRA